MKVLEKVEKFSNGELFKYEELTSNHRRWLRFQGSEGQDVYVAMFKDDCEHLIGEFTSENDEYDILCEDKDTDFYVRPQNNLTRLLDSVEDIVSNLSEDDLAFKYRKGVFNVEEQSGAFQSLYGAASPSDNRGMAVGKVDKSGRPFASKHQLTILELFKKGKTEKALKKSNKNDDNTLSKYVWLKSEVIDEFGDMSNFFPKLVEKLSSLSPKEASEYADKIRKKCVSNTSRAGKIWSGIAGFYDRYPRIPFGRLTSYTKKNMKKFEKCFPFTRKLNSEFKRLLPTRWGNQNEETQNIDKKFLIGEDTVFSTITVNTTTPERNARMAYHRDKGSSNSGFSNLTIVSEEGREWQGGYLVIPEVGVAINVRCGDLLLIDNMNLIHGNTPITGVDGNDFLRMSMVFYLREGMKKLGSFEYENIRNNFVESRKNNPNHPLQKKGFNGVSPSMWLGTEWFNFLKKNGGEEMLSKYHPVSDNLLTNNLGRFFSSSPLFGEC